jgi:cell division septation protein DedD
MIDLHFKGTKMEDNKVKDILIEEKNGSSKQKKLILVVAGLLLIFIISVAVMKTIYGNEESSQLPPEPDAIESATSEFEKVPIKDAPVEIDDKFKKIIDEISSSKSVETPTSNIQDTNITKDKKIKKVNNDPVVQTKKTKNLPKVLDTSVPVGYYVQVGAFYEQSPNKQLLKKIIDKNYKYYLFKTKLNSKNVIKVLIGVYNSKAKAKAKLQIIRDNFSKDAYIFTKSK